MRKLKLSLLLLSLSLVGCGLLGGVAPTLTSPPPTERRRQPTFPPTWTLPAPTDTPTITPTRTPTGTLTPTPSLTPQATITPASHDELAAALATEMAGRPPPTPMLACQAKASMAGIPLASAPFLGDVQATMVPGQSYEITAWHTPMLYLSLNGSPRGWVGIPREGLELEGTGCMPESAVDLDDLYGFPNVCLFLALGGSIPPDLYLEPSLDSMSLFQTVIGYYLGQVGEFYSVTMSGSGPTGYVHQSAGQLVGECP